MAKLKITGLLLLVAVSILSCRKDNDKPEPAAKKLVVKLDNHIILASDIDSANVVLRRSGTNTPYFLRFEKKEDRLEATIDGLPAGEYASDIELYTNQMPSSKYYQFISTRQIDITAGNGNVTIDGPDELGVDGWDVRKVIPTTSREIVVLIPLNVNDPYFEVRRKGTNWNFVGVERIATQGAAVVAHKNWQCENNCAAIGEVIYDRVIFEPFTETIRNTNWTKNTILITVANTQTQEFYEFEHQWDK